MRDLDQLQEHDPERGRSVGTWLALSAAVLLLLGAAFLWWRHGEKAGVAPEDPLDELAQLARSDPQRAPDADKNSARPKAAPKLTYERALTEDEDRPEVVAALAAAAREEERLAKSPPGEAKKGASPPAPAALADDEEEADDEAQGVRATAPIPAGLAASSAGSRLEKSAEHDKLVAAAMPKLGKSSTRAGGSGDGEFMLQVISYGARVQADAFAAALRERGHEAFVEVSEINGRGRTYRVRIGPFKSKPAADAYRRDFDEREHMNTIVVRRDD